MPNEDLTPAQLDGLMKELRCQAEFAAFIPSAEFLTNKSIYVWDGVQLERADGWDISIPRGVYPNPSSVLLVGAEAGAVSVKQVR